MADTWTQKPYKTIEDQTGPDTTETGSAGGFQDTGGQYPREDYFNTFSVNRAASGGNRNDLYVGGGAEGVDLGLNDQGSAAYSMNQVQESASGHVIEIDDTPGNQRILVKHNSGAGIEVRDDGTIFVSAKNNKVELTVGDHTMVVEGNGNVVYKGNLNLEVAGDYTVDVKGNYVVSVGGNRAETVTGADRKTVHGGVGAVINGGYSTTVNGQVTNTYIGGMSNNVKGTFSNNVDGAANFFSSGSTTITAESDLIGAADNMTLSAQDMTVQGDTGTIGGENIIMYNYNMYTGHSIEAGDTIATQTANISNTINTDKVTAASFHGYFVGDLKGTAENADNPGTFTPGTESSAADVANDNTETALPTAALLSELLSKTAAGIRRVKIDVGDFIKNTIDRTTANAGISATPVNTPQARSKLRDPANRANPNFVATLVKTGAVKGECFEQPAPKGIGRTVKGDPTPVSSGKNGSTAVFERGEIRVVPQWEYNPINTRDVITAKTKVGKGVTVAKFLGTEDPVNLDFIKDNKAKLDIARYYTVHAQIMNTVNDGELSDDFDNLKLVVAEGLYKPGPQEDVTPDSLNDLKLKGRAVAYKLINSKGKESNVKLFDLAVKWKDTIPYDELILSYDTIDCNLNARLIVVLPKLDDEYKGKFGLKVKTEFNGNLLADGELVEALEFSTSSGGTGSNQPDPSTESFPPVPLGNNGKLSAGDLGNIGNGKQLRRDAAGDWNRLVADARKAGVTITAGSAYRTYEHQAGLWANGAKKYPDPAVRRKWIAPPGRSNHGYGIAVDVSEIYGRRSSGAARGIPAYEWLRNNAARYNFYQRMEWEPWHWEYTINNPYLK